MFQNIPRNRNFQEERQNLIRKWALGIMGITIPKWGTLPFCSGRKEIERRSKTRQHQNEARHYKLRGTKPLSITIDDAKDYENVLPNLQEKHNN